MQRKGSVEMLPRSYMFLCSTRGSLIPGAGSLYCMPPGPFSGSLGF
jgi:hypothetical protein